MIERASGLGQLHALLIAVDGSRLVEQRFRGPALGTPVNVKPVSKTVVSALLGAAIGRGEITLDVTLGEVAPDLIPSGADPRVAGITMEDLASLPRRVGAHVGAELRRLDRLRRLDGDALARGLGAR